MIKCSICLSNIYRSDSADSTDCGHVFHSSCLIQWHLQSTTCPQCRAVCIAGNIRRLYFNSSVNNSPAVDAISGNDQLLKVDSIMKESLIKKNQLMVQLSQANLTYLVTRRQFEISKLNAAAAQINHLKIEYRRLRNLERGLNENTKEWQGMDDGTRNFINSAASEVGALLNETPESLAKMVVMLRGQLINKEMKRNEVLNTLKVCQVENLKLNANKRQLRGRFSSLQTDDNKEN